MRRRNVCTELSFHYFSGFGLTMACLKALQRLHSHLVGRRNLSHTERNVKLENNIREK